jgi:purine-nucleoside phosphorylase
MNVQDPFCSMNNLMTRLQESAEFLKIRFPVLPRIALILGTGLGDLVNETEILLTISYRDIPHFPVATAETHAGQLHLARWEGKEILIFQGRFHAYEGYSMVQVTWPVRISGLLGIHTLLISNISGALNPDYHLSDLVALEDHINLQTENPLTGPNLSELGPRWPDMVGAYDPDLLDQAIHFAGIRGIRLHKGVYVSVPGPNLETPAEYRYLSRIGGDCVGMSTVPEVLVARHMNMRVFALSAISDLGYGTIQKVELESLLEAAAKAQPKMTAIFRHLISLM